MNKVIKYVVIDILKNKIVLGYTLLLLLVSLSVFSLDDSASRGVITLLNLVLLIVPLVSIIFSTIYIYNASEFIELLVTQPIKRSKIWRSIMFGLMFSLGLAFILGAAIPLILFDGSAAAYSLIFAGIMLSIIFVAIAMLAVVLTRDKAKGIGLGILLWFYFTILYDGIVLFVLFQFSDYPMEIPMLFMTALNPVDLARILILLKLDISALMGYTGAVFKSFFSSGYGMGITALVLVIWAFLPSWLSLKKFKIKDL